MAHELPQDLQRYATRNSDSSLNIIVLSIIWSTSPFLCLWEFSQDLEDVGCLIWHSARVCRTSCLYHNVRLLHRMESCRLKTRLCSRASTNAPLYLRNHSGLWNIYICELDNSFEKVLQCRKRGSTKRNLKGYPEEGTVGLTGTKSWLLLRSTGPLKIFHASVLYHLQD